MTIWATFRSDLLTAVQGMVDPELCAVVWRDNRQPYLPNRILCRLTIRSITGKLVERRYLPGTSDAVYYYAEQATVGFLFESVSQEDVDTPLGPADDIAGLLQYTRVNDDVSFKESTEIRDVSVAVDDRMMAACEFEATFNVLITLPVTTGTGVIQDVQLSEELANGVLTTVGPREISITTLAANMLGEGLMSVVLT